MSTALAGVGIVIGTGIGIGIDIGNRNCTIAQAKRGGIDIVLNGNSQRLNA